MDIVFNFTENAEQNLSLTYYNETLPCYNHRYLVHYINHLLTYITLKKHSYIKINNVKPFIHCLCLTNLVLTLHMHLHPVFVPVSNHPQIPYLHAHSLFLSGSYYFIRVYTSHHPQAFTFFCGKKKNTPYTSQ